MKSKKKYFQVPYRQANVMQRNWFSPNGNLAVISESVTKGLLMPYWFSAETRNKYLCIGSKPIML